MHNSEDKTTLELAGVTWANALLTNALEWTTFDSLPNEEQMSQAARSILMIGHAHVQQQERIWIEKKERLEAIDESLKGIKDALTSLALPRDGFKPELKALDCNHAYEALKARWIRLHPEHTGIEHDEAMREFSELVGL